MILEVVKLILYYWLVKRKFKWMKYNNIRKIGGDYFRILKGKGWWCNLTYEDILNLNINYDDYVILKSTRNQKIVSKEEFLSFKYSGYLFIKKELFNEDVFNFWVNFITFPFIHKPLPGIELVEKIIIMK